jgi:hypothetical protein
VIEYERQGKVEDQSGSANKVVNIVYAMGSK